MASIIEMLQVERHEFKNGETSLLAVKEQAGMFLRSS
jgi:hypothetical protein